MKNISPKEAKVKLYRYCVYQERCHQDVKEKLSELGLWGEEAGAIIAHLIQEGFLNEERFAKAYASGKFRLKHWGKLKIVRGLEQRGLSRHCILAGLNEISESDYRQTILQLLEKKASTTEAPNIYTLRDKVAKSVIQKGFEPELVWALLKETVRG
jgi:regulatory protein